MFTALLVVALYYLAFAAAVVLPTSAVLHLEDLADPPQPTEPPAQTGPICTLVDGGDTGGTFCNLWTGNGSITDTNWVSTVTPSALASKISATATTTSPAPPPPNPTPAECGEVGDFEITFDNLPPATVHSNETGIFSPVSHFTWGTSFAINPPPAAPYVSQSGNVLLHSASTVDNSQQGSPQAGRVPAKGFGAGARNAIDAFWFNITAAYVQCEFPGTSASQNECVFYASPWRYDHNSGLDRVQGPAQSWVQKKCLDPPCHLNKIDFGPQFNMLSAISFYGVIDGKTVDFYMDSLQMQWYNNTCEAGLTRVSSRK